MPRADQANRRSGWLFPDAVAAFNSAKNNMHSDEELVARAVAGEKGAFDQIVMNHSPRLYGLIFHLTSDHQDTNDLLQVAFEKAFQLLNGFRGRSSLCGWLQHIALDVTLAFLRKRVRN